MALNWSFIVNGVDFAPDIERDSYDTQLIQITSDVLTTRDGVDHFAKIRDKGWVAVEFNPRTEDRVRLLCQALLTQPCTVQYHCLQRNETVVATMRVNGIPTASFLSRCLADASRWVQLGSIEFEEL